MEKYAINITTKEKKLISCAIDKGNKILLKICITLLLYNVYNIDEHEESKAADR